MCSERNMELENIKEYVKHMIEEINKCSTGIKNPKQFDLLEYKTNYLFNSEKLISKYLNDKSLVNRCLEYINLNVNSIKNETVKSLCETLLECYDTFNNSEFGLGNRMDIDIYIAEKIYNYKVKLNKSNPYQDVGVNEVSVIMLRYLYAYAYSLNDDSIMKYVTNSIFVFLVRYIGIPTYKHEIIRYDEITNEYKLVNQSNYSLCSKVDLDYLINTLVKNYLGFYDDVPEDYLDWCLFLKLKDNYKEIVEDKIDIVVNRLNHEYFYSSSEIERLFILPSSYPKCKIKYPLENIELTSLLDIDTLNIIGSYTNGTLCVIEDLLDINKFSVGEDSTDNETVLNCEEVIVKQPLIDITHLCNISSQLYTDNKFIDRTLLDKINLEYNINTESYEFLFRYDVISMYNLSIKDIFMYFLIIDKLDIRNKISSYNIDLIITLIDYIKKVDSYSIIDKINNSDMLLYLEYSTVNDCNVYDFEDIINIMKDTI